MSGQHPCARGPAQMEAMIGFHRGAGGQIVAQSLQNGAAPAVKAHIPCQALRPRIARRDQKSLISPDYRLDLWSRLAALHPRGERSRPSRDRSGRSGASARPRFRQSAKQEPP